MTWAPKGRRRRVQPKTTWRCREEKQRNEMGRKTWTEVGRVVADREECRRPVEALCNTKEIGPGKGNIRRLINSCRKNDTYIYFYIFKG